MSNIQYIFNPQEMGIFDHTVNFKTRKYFKDKKSRYEDEGEWIIFKDIYDAIISQETFDNMQRIWFNVKRYQEGWCEAHPPDRTDIPRRLLRKMYAHSIYHGNQIA